MRKLVLVLSVPLLTLAAPASAHFDLAMPPAIAEKTEVFGKGPAPCGPDTAATGTVTNVTGGAALTLLIHETTPHTGFYRFALALKSPPQFPADNVVKDQQGKVLLPTSTAQSFSADFESPAVFPVLADHMFDHTGDAAQSFPSATYPGQVIIPNINCAQCTLQVIEFMAQHPSNGSSAGYFYHHCALLKITADPNKPIFDPNAAAGGAGGTGGAAGMAGASTAGGGASTAGAGGTSTAGTGGTGGPGGTGGADSAGAPGAAGAGAGGTLAAAGGTVAAGSPGAAGFSPGGVPGIAGAGSDQPASDGGCSYAHGKHPNPSKPALALLLGMVGFVMARRRASRRG